MSVGIIIQARMGSTRLPGKVMKPIAGRLLLDHILDRLSMLAYPVKVVVATSKKSEDDAITRHCLARDVAVFRGSEISVLERYFQCAREKEFQHIVRLTADNPFVDIEELDRLILQHTAEKNDYTHSFGNLPLGVGAEIFTFATLERSMREGRSPNHWEHVNEYVQENPKLFKIGFLKVVSAKHCPGLRLTVDTEDDYKRACAIAGYAPDRWIGTEEAIRLCLPSV